MNCKKNNNSGSNRAEKNKQARNSRPERVGWKWIREIGNQRDADKCWTSMNSSSSSSSNEFANARFLIRSNINGSDVLKICIFILTFFFCSVHFVPRLCYFFLLVSFVWIAVWVMVMVLLLLLLLGSLTLNECCVPLFGFRGGCFVFFPSLSLVFFLLCSLITILLRMCAP